MRWMRALAAGLVLAFSAPVALAHELGPAVGASLPVPVTARDQTGTQRDFASLAGANGLVLVFTRSADWCPFCQAQLIGLEGARVEIERRGWRLAATTHDDVAKLARFTQRRSIGYPLLSDADARLVTAYGLLDTRYPPGHRAHGVPVPTILFLSPQGVVRARLGDENYRVRPAPEVVLATIDSLR